MEGQVIQLKAPSSSYSKELYHSLWLDPAKDCTIYCEDGQVDIHLALLASISPVMRSCSVGDMAGLSLPGTSLQQVSALVRILYLGETLASKDDQNIVEEIANSLLKIPLLLNISQQPQQSEDDYPIDDHPYDDEKVDDPVAFTSIFQTNDLLRKNNKTCQGSSDTIVTLDKNLNDLDQPEDDAFSSYLKPKRKHAKSNLPEQANVNYQEAIKILVCGVCGIRTDNFYPLMKKHYETVHFVREEKTFYCPTESCNKKIASTNSFHSHIHIVHREASYHCTQCAKKFKTSGSLAHHTARWHTSDRPLVCQQCGEGIASALHLEAHMRMHRSKHVCQVCNKKFLSASHLEKHRVTHTSERPFMCGTCGKTFRDPYSVKECEKKHQGLKKLKPSQLIPWRNREAKFVCDTCGYRTKGKAALDRHIKGKHSKEKPYPCKECGKDFKSKSNLDSHTTVHEKNTNAKLRTENKDSKECDGDTAYKTEDSDVAVQTTTNYSDSARASTAYFWMPHSNFTQSLI
jgi:DNA-directed RNA polymerase subunit RPC12/RpoP